MGKILITGSADGLGQLAARALVDQGHEVALHARDEKRAKEALQKVPGAKNCLVGDLSSAEETQQVAVQANANGHFSAIIHNAGVYNATSEEILAVNVIAPYILTCLIHKPKRLIYLSSGDHLWGHTDLKNLKASQGVSYSASKLLLVQLCKAVARHWPDIYANAVDPGWVPTKMGGPGAPDDLQKGYETQVWLAVSDDPKVTVTGRYFFHQKETRSNPEGDDVTLQEELLKRCAAWTGIQFPK